MIMNRVTPLEGSDKVLLGLPPYRVISLLISVSPFACESSSE